MTRAAAKGVWGAHVPQPPRFSGLFICRTFRTRSSCSDREPGPPDATPGLRRNRFFPVTTVTEKVEIKISPNRITTVKKANPFSHNMI